MKTGGAPVLKFSNCLDLQGGGERRWEIGLFPCVQLAGKPNYKGDKAQKWMRTDVFKDLRANSASHSFSVIGVIWLCFVRSGGAETQSFAV